MFDKPDVNQANRELSPAIRRKVNLRAGCRLFCFPYSGGGASAYGRWAPHLPDSIELCAIQPPGREDRFGAPFASTLRDLVDGVCDSILCYLDLPFIFFGHSSGAILAFEVIRALRARGLPSPKRLIASACRAPQFRWPKAGLHELPDDHLIEELRHLNGLSEELLRSKELMEIVLPRIRADLALLGSYSCDAVEQLDCSLTAIGGLYDRSVTREQLLGWREQTTAAFHFRIVAGDHFYVTNALGLILRTVARETEEALREAAIATVD